MENQKTGLISMSLGLLILGLIAGYIIGDGMSSYGVVSQTPTTTPLNIYDCDPNNDTDEELGCSLHTKTATEVKKRFRQILEDDDTIMPYLKGSGIGFANDCPGYKNDGISRLGFVVFLKEKTPFSITQKIPLIFEAYPVCAKMEIQAILTN